ncbi:MAG: hypothetical protein LBC03_03620, partial [Nitrososphaerota archaeon]|nr:hypothetical protein [Nitrososphaerota archaeon]
TFTGWDTNFINITTNLIITAQYTQQQQTTQNSNNNNPQSTPFPKQTTPTTPTSPNTNLPGPSIPNNKGTNDTTNSASLTERIEEPLVTWVLLNLALSIAGILFAILTITAVMLQKKTETNKTQKNTTQPNNQNKTVWLTLTTALSIAIFLLTQNMHGNMTMTDNWTILNAIILTVQIITIALTFKSKKPQK